MTARAVDYYPPVSRPTDPVTSRQGENEVTGSGRRRTHMQIVLDAVVAHPGITAGAVGEITALGHWRATKRLSDLKNKGFIEQGQPVEWHGRQQVTWWPVERQQPLPGMK